MILDICFEQSTTKYLFICCPRVEGLAAVPVRVKYMLLISYRSSLPRCQDDVWLPAAFRRCSWGEIQFHSQPLLISFKESAIHAISLKALSCNRALLNLENETQFLSMAAAKTQGRAKIELYTPEYFGAC